MQEGVVCLSELEHSPPAAVLKSVQPFLDAVIKSDILNHQDKDVFLITRITTPEVPYPDSIMKVVSFSNILVLEREGDRREEPEMDPEVAEMMGFGGFGSFKTS